MLRPVASLLLAVTALLRLSLPIAAQKLEWNSTPSHRWASVPQKPAQPPGFERIEPLAAGIVFTNWCDPDRSITNRNLLSGSGVACGDIDGDGLTDLYFCGLQSSNRLFRNLGAWKFSDLTGSSGLAEPPQDSTGATFADVDGDGDLDLLVNSLGHGTRLFLNDGRGHFTESTDAAGLRSSVGAMSLALADIDGDGDLDIYVANFRPGTVRDQPQTRYAVRMVNNRPVVVGVNQRPLATNELQRFRVAPGGEVLEYGEPDDLWINDGKGHFTAAPQAGPTWLDEQGRPLPEPVVDWGLAVQFRDLNGDGRPDLYVCNDLFTPDRIWINECTPGNIRFRALPSLALRNTSTFSMGVDFGDLDRDGHVDFFVVDMLSRNRAWTHFQMSEGEPQFLPPGVIDYRPQLARNTLQWGRGDGTWAEGAYYAGVAASEWSWGPIFLDVDLDGFEDILVTNGQLRDFQNLDGQAAIEAIRQRKGQLSQADLAEQVRSLPRLDTPNIAFRNRRDRTFADTSVEWGFGTPGISQGMALCDLDNDGAADIVINNLNAPPGLYRNRSAAARLAVRLAGNPPNTRGIGANIRVISRRADGSEFVQAQEMIAGGRYVSGDDPVRFFAGAPATASSGPLRIEVTWRSGRTSRIDDAQAGRVYEVREPETGATAPGGIHATNAIARSFLFEDYSNRLAHNPAEVDFNDFERQMLLPNRLSRLGPAVCWADFNGDGWEDVALGTGNGGRITVLLNSSKGTFGRMNAGAITNLINRDVLGLVALPGKPPGLQLLAATAAWEDGRTNDTFLRLYDLDASIASELPARLAASAAALATADVDADGTLDVFVGGRVVPGHYPNPAPSQLLLRKEGRFLESPQNAPAFASVGLVNAAVFSDLDSDGDPDLVLACEWGSLRLFRNDHGTFTPWVPAIRREGDPGTRPLSDWTGWWNGVTTGDFDGDGRLDIAASNWGLNTRFGQPDRATPRLLYAGALGGAGEPDLVEGFRDATGAEWPERKLNITAMAFPWMREKFPTHAAYAAANLAGIYGDRLQSARRYEATCLQHAIFLNRGDQFEMRPLPTKAQFAPGFSIVVADCDGNGTQDLFLAQNFFAAQPTADRADSGRGLWLRNDGTGHFVEDDASGVRVYGEQRGAAVADFDHDGRIDLIVTQNGAPTRFYHNIGARPGLRIVLNGPPSNPSAIGAVVQLSSGTNRSPAAEIHGGSGFLSQDSPVLVLQRPGADCQLEVRWPTGARTRHPVPPTTREVQAFPDGRTEAVSRD